MKTLKCLYKREFLYFSILLLVPIFSFCQVKSKLTISSTGNTISVQLYPIKENGKYGYINKLGKVIIKPQFDGANDFNGNYAIIKISGKFGFIDKNGKIVVNPIFEDLQNISDGLARIKMDGKFGFINSQGKIVIKPQFDNVENFSNGLAKIKIGGKYGFIDLKGEIVTNPQIDEVSYFSEGLAKIKIGGKYGFINLNGEIVIKPKFFSANAFSDGLALAAIEEDWPWTNNSGYIDKTGNYVIQPQFGFQSGDFKEGIAPASVDRKFGYINKKGQFIIQPQFNSAFPFHEGLAWVSYSESGGAFVLEPDAKWGCIDKSGKFVLNPQDFSWPGNFSEGLCYVKEKIASGEITDFGYINKNGDFMIQPSYKVANDFEKGWARVKLNDEWGIINKSGKFFPGEIFGELIRVTVNNEFSYLDKQGNWIWRPK